MTGQSDVSTKRVFDLVKDFGTSESPKSTRSSTTHWCPGRPGHPAFRHNIASSLRLHTGLPYDWTPRSDAPLGSPLAPSARRVSRVASRLPGTTRLRFALHGGQRMPCAATPPCSSVPTASRRAGNWCSRYWTSGKRCRRGIFPTTKPEAGGRQKPTNSWKRTAASGATGRCHHRTIGTPGFRAAQHQRIRTLPDT